MQTCLTCNFKRIRRQLVLLTICVAAFCGAAPLVVEGSGLCGDGVVDSDEQCDDGNTVNLDGCSAECRRETYFQCYRSLVAVPQPAIAPMSLVDQFATLAASVIKPVDLCTPTNTNGVDPAAPGLLEHEESYLLHVPEQRVNQHHEVTVPNVTVASQFGTLHVNVMWPMSLLVPSANSLDSLPSAPVAPVNDHFTCYGVRPVLGAPRFAPIHGVTVVDQFGSATVNLAKPMRLCVPTDPDGSEPGAPSHSTHLVCFRTRGQQRPKIGRVFVNNQFGPGALYPRWRDELCVPAVTSP